MNQRRALPVTAGTLAIVLVILAGALCIAMPFWGDQALFTVYGRELTHGAVLYRDVFDVKQPGIFAFYAAAGSLFGFTEVGIHLFELLYWLAFSVFAIIALRPYFASRWTASLVPIFTVVPYYLSSGLLELTQVEILVGFPILAAWWLIDRADARSREGIRRYVFAGLCAAAVILFKHLYVLIVLAFLGLGALRARRNGVGGGRILGSIGAFALALGAPLVLVAAYFAAYGQLGRIWWAYFEMAPSAQLGGSRPVSYLIAGARRFLIGFAPLVILAVMGTVRALQRRTREGSDLGVGMIAWLVVGAFAFAIQGWPEYKWSLFTVPVGILAAVGVEAVRASVPRSSRASVAIRLVVLSLIAALGFEVANRSAGDETVLLVVVMIGIVVAAAAAWLGTRNGGSALLFAVGVIIALGIGLVAVAPIEKVRTLAGHGFALTVDARADYRRSLNDAYRAADDDLATLRERGFVLDGPIYVFGDPILLLRAGVAQAIPIAGWGPESLDRRAWGELDSDLRTTPPGYIVVDAHIGRFVERTQPSIIDWISSKYRVAFVGESGTWFVRRS